MRKRHWLWIAPLAVLGTALAAGGWLLGTERGFVALLSLAQRFAPGELRVEQASGRVLGGFVLDGVDYRDGPMRLALRECALDWSPRALFDSRLRIDRLHLRGLDLALPPPVPMSPPPPVEPPHLPQIRLPLAIELADVDMSDVRIAGSGAPLVLDHARLRAALDDTGLSIDTFELAMPGVTASAHGQVKPTAAYPTRLDLRWHLAETPLGGPLDGEGRIEGDAERLTLSHHTQGVVRTQIEGEAQALLGALTWRADVDVEPVDLGTLVPELKGRPLAATLRANGDRRQAQIGALTLALTGTPATLAAAGTVSFTEPRVDLRGHWEHLQWPLAAPTVRSPQGRFTVAGTPDDYRASVDASLAADAWGVVDAALALHGGREDVTLERIALASPDGKLRLNADGHYAFAEQRFAARGTWQNLAWPLLGPPQIESAEGRFDAMGTAADYRFALAAKLRGPNIPAGDWTLAGTGSAQAVDVPELHVDALDGRIDGTLAARWVPQVEWRATLAGRELNPGRFAPQWPGRIGFALNSTGRLATDGAVQAGVELDSLAGTLNGQKLAGTLSAKLDGERLELPRFALALGGARVEAEGRLDREWDLHWKLRVPDLGQTLPGAKGTLNGEGALNGPREQPQVSLTLDGRELAVAGNTLARLSAKAELDALGRTRSAALVTASRMNVGGQAFDTLELRADGTPERHQATLKLNGEPARLTLALSGGLHERLWEGRVQALDLFATALGDWRLQQPAAITAGAARAKLGPLCLASAPTRMCVSGDWSAAADSEATLRIERFTAARLAKLLPPGLALDTELDADATAKIAAGSSGLPAIQLNARLKPGRLRYTGGAEAVSFPLSGELKAETTASEIRAALKLGLGTGDGLDANFTLADPAGAQRLGGRVRASFTQVGALRALVPQLSNPRGRLNADLALAGSASKPLFKGQARLDDGGLEVPSIGLKISELTLAATGTPQGGLQFSGDARAGSGSLTLGGAWQPEPRRFQLDLHGQDFQIADSEALRAAISPVLAVQLEGDQLHIDGEVTVPRAHITPPDTSSAITPSDDVRRSDLPAAAQGKPLNVFVRVRVILGDAVSVETAGFKAELTGNLLVEQIPPLAPRGSGIIGIKAGEYRVYGQNLEIERGQLLFSGGPLDNPGLDIRAVRTVDDVKAGARITGSAKKPVMKVFSEPTMPDSSVLSYLVFGRAPDASSGGESALLGRAVAALATGGGNSVGKKLGTAIGLDQFGFESSGTGGTKDTALMLGKYLTPDLYVSYGIGLFEPVASFLMRYQLTKYLRVETRTSGTATAADLLYSLER